LTIACTIVSFFSTCVSDFNCKVSAFFREAQTTFRVAIANVLGKFVILQQFNPMTHYAVHNMKTTKLLLSALALMAGATACSNVELPAEADEFVAAAFPSAKITRIKTERDHGYIEYEVRLNNGAKIDFDVANQWESIDCEDALVDVPMGVLDAQIASYVQENYPGESVIDVDRNRRGYELKLGSGLKLFFNLKGEFLRSK
jgi:hypothetical protein